MNIKVSNYIELIHAIHNANMHSTEATVIELTGKNDDFILHDYAEIFYGKVGLPPITGNVTINGNGLTIARAEDASPFRLLAINSVWNRHAMTGRLILNDLTLANGKSWIDGGGALINNGELLLNQCTFRDNVGTLGGAIYNGDGHPLAATGCVFENNVALLEGGAIYNSNLAQTRLEGCKFNNNRAVKGQQADIFVFTTVHPLRFVDGESDSARVAMNGVALQPEEVKTLNRFAEAAPANLLPPTYHTEGDSHAEDDYDD